MTYQQLEADHYDEASDRHQYTRYSAEHDAAVMFGVVASIRKALIDGMRTLDSQLHCDNAASSVAIAAIMEELGEQLDDPACGLWHGMCRVIEVDEAAKAAA